MSIEVLTEFFRWCVVFTLILYGFTAVVTIFARDFLYNLEKRWFALSRPTFDAAMFGYLAGFKLLLIVFVICPYLALLMMR